MTISLEVWHVAVLTTVFCWWRAWRLEEYGSYDFVTPMKWMLWVCCPVLMWAAFFLGAWLR